MDGEQRAYNFIAGVVLAVIAILVIVNVLEAVLGQ